MMPLQPEHQSPQGLCIYMNKTPRRANLAFPILDGNKRMTSVTMHLKLAAVQWHFLDIKRQMLDAGTNT